MNEQIPPIEFSDNDNERQPLNFETYRKAVSFMEDQGYTVIDMDSGGGKSIERGDTELSIWFSDIAKLQDMVGGYLMSSDSEEKCTLLAPLKPKEVDTRTEYEKMLDSPNDTIM